MEEKKKKEKHIKICIHFLDGLNGQSSTEAKETTLTYVASIYTSLMEMLYLLSECFHFLKKATVQGTVIYALS